MNNVYKKLLDKINVEKESFSMLVSADNVLGLNVSVEDINNYLEFAGDDNSLNGPIIGNIIITEGDILSVLKILNDLKRYNGEYVLYINNDNIGTISYLVNRTNTIYKELGINIKINVDYSNNYNEYLNELVNIIGSKKFIDECSKDFTNANHIIV